MAVCYLSIPATSASSERVFSVAGLTLTERRRNLVSDSVDMVVTCHDNLDMIRVPSAVKDARKHKVAQDRALRQKRGFLSASGF